MNDKEYLYILDYLTDDIYEIEVDANSDKDVFKIIKQYGCNPGCCFWMFSNRKIDKITKLTKDEATN